MEWDDYAADWDDNPAVCAYAERAFQSLQSLATATGFMLEGAKACDFGCGTGLLTERLAGSCAHIDAIDASPAMLEVLRAKINRHGWSQVSFQQSLPEAPQPYDLIVCSSVLAFVDDYAATAHELISHLAEGGLFVQWDWELDPDDAAPQGLTRDTIRRTLTEAGLTGVTVDVGFEIAVDDTTMSPLMGSGRMPG